MTAEVNRNIIHFHCKHFVKDATGSECRCALGRAEFWNEDMCFVDKETHCPSLDTSADKPASDA